MQSKCEFCKPGSKMGMLSHMTRHTNVEISTSTTAQALICCAKVSGIFCESTLTVTKEIGTNILKFNQLSEVSHQYF